MTNISIQTVTCKRCGYEWIPRTKEVRTCANSKCRSPYWDRERGEKPNRQGELQMKVAPGKPTHLISLKKRPIKSKK